MKDLVRLRTSLTEEMEQALNDQVRMEARASSVYLAMATWCDNHGFANSAEFLYKQSGEEREHMIKIFKYLNDSGGRAISPEVTDIPLEYDSLKAVFEQGLEQEISTTQSIHRIVDKCYKLKDYTTLKFLQWFIDEQAEEEYIFRRILELFDVIGTEGVGLYMIDKKIPEVKVDNAGA